MMIKMNKLERMDDLQRKVEIVAIVAMIVGVLFFSVTIL